VRTVQSVFQDVLRDVTQEHIVVEFAGRTDTGVHAAGQVVSFDTNFRHAPEVLQRALNAGLPPDVRVLRAGEAQPGFSARRSARQRWYRYIVDNGKVAHPLRQRYAHWEPRRLNVQAMNAAAGQLLGWHDFSAFGQAPSPISSSVRRMDWAAVERDGETVTVDLKATAFLRGMARSITGTLLRVGSGVITPGEVGRILEQRARWESGPPAPAKGLCLMGVSYES